MNELCQKMSSPNQHSLAKLKRLARYLKRERQWGQVFEYGKLAEGADSVHGLGLGQLQGDSKVVERRRADAGKTHPESLHTKAEGHCKEQRRSRTVCSSIGSVRREGVQSMMGDLSFAVKPVLITDAKATKHILHRHGIGKKKPIDVAHLWLQDEVTSEDNLVDIRTKALSNKIVRKHATSTEYIDAQGNWKSGDAVGLCGGKSERADQSSPDQQETSLEPTDGHARQQQR